VCGSAYGIEEAISAGGPLLAIGTLLGVTLVWLLSMVLVVSELCACRAQPRPTRHAELCVRRRRRLEGRRRERCVVV